MPKKHDSVMVRHRITCLILLLIFPFAFSPAGHAEEPFVGKSIHQIKEMIFDSLVKRNSKPRAFLVADRGRIFRRTGDEKKWEEITSGVREPLFSITFPTPQNGWISGASGLILHSEDSGDTWKTQKTPRDKHLFTIHFADAMHGCAAGDWGTILRTDDGGQTWHDVSLDEDVVLYGICMTDANTGWLVGEFGRIYRTEDGGASWRELPMIAMQSLFCLDVDDDTIVAAGLDGGIVYSHNGGETWSQAVNPSNKSLYGIALNGKEGWAVGDLGVLVHTADAGRSWTPVGISDKPSALWDRRGHSFLFQFPLGAPL